MEQHRVVDMAGAGAPPPSSSPSSSMFDPENRERLEASFRAFASRPENRPFVEEQQRADAAAAAALAEAAREAELKRQVLSLPADLQRDIKPALRHAVLRRMLQAMSNGDGGDGGDGASSGNDGKKTPPLARWAENRAAVELLARAARALRRGEVSEAQLEAALLSHLGGGDGAAAAAVDGGQRLASAAGVKAVLPTHVLVDALNEHLSEFNAGCAALDAGDVAGATAHLRRARAVVDFVEAEAGDGGGAAELSRCHAALAACEAEALLAAGEAGAAAARCGQGLLALRSRFAGGNGGGIGGGASGSPPPALGGGAAVADAADLEAALLVRRAEALLARHEPRAALSDLDAAEAVDPGRPGVREARDEARAKARALGGGGGGGGARASRNPDAALAARMLRGLSVAAGGGRA